MRRHQESIQANRAAGQRLPIAGQDEEGMSMQMHWMEKIALIVESDLYQLPLLYHNHWDVGKNLAVDGIGHAHAPHRGPHLVIQNEGRSNVKVAPQRDASGSRFAIGCKIEPGLHDGKRRRDLSLAENGGWCAQLVLVVVCVRGYQC